MRILVTACPFAGHVNTVLPFAVAAHRAGHDVVFATGADFTTVAAQHGLHTWAIGPTAEAAGMPESLEFFWRTGSLRVADLLPRVAEWQPELVVAEELELAGGVVAARSDAQYVVHGLGIAATGDAPDELTAPLDAFGAQHDVTGLGHRYQHAPYVTVCPPALRGPTDNHRSVYELRHVVGQPAPGYRLPVDMRSLPRERTVHLTLGTVFHELRPAVLETAIEALGSMPVNLVVTTGPGVDPRQFGARPSHVVIERYLPHSLLLPECDVVVSHGGAGVVLGALAEGLPQLVLPQAADQFLNAAAVQRSGTGLALDSDATGAAITAGIERLLAESSYSVAAQSVRNEIAAMPNAADTVAAVTSSVLGNAG